MPAAPSDRTARATRDDDSTDRDALRQVMPLPVEDAADELVDKLAEAQFRAERFGAAVDVRLDRYVLRRKLGQGGMGVVFEAYDPVLMVPVALKLLQRVGAAETQGADLALQREAQSLAAVEGDHVVRVYTAGFYKRQPWIAMQLVPGPDLAEWLRYRRARGPLGWREVLPKFVDAARGLAAIHRAGLIHRDFKPHNAVVDPRGRVRVLDFGLATADRRPIDPGAAVGAHLRGGATRTGALVGTLRYASPEQFVGRDLDHRSDQFSFCVALFEGLWDRPPFGDEVPPGLHLNAEPAAAPTRPPGDVPTWLFAAVARGLRGDREQRFASMDALLHELTRDRRRPLRVGGLVLGGALVGGALAVLPGGPDPLATCLAGQAAIDELAVDGAAPVARVAAWKAALAAACRDTHGGGEAPETLLARRQACLDGDRAALAAVLARAPADDRERAVRELPPPANCLDEGLGRVAAPRDPDTRARVAAVDERLAEALAGRVLGDYEAALAAARDALAGAIAAGHLPAVARAHLAVGELARLLDRRGPAEDALLAAAAEAGRTDDLVVHVRALHELVRLALLGERAADNAGPYLKLAAAALPAVDPGPAADASPQVQALRAEHADMRGLLAYADGRHAEAIEAHGEAIAAWQQLMSRTDVRRELAASLLDRGRARSDHGDHAAAIADHEAALALELERFGPDHRSLAANHRSLAIEHLTIGARGPAERAARRALELDERHGASTAVAYDLQVLVKLALDAGDLSAATRLAAAMRDAAAADPDGPPRLRAHAEYTLAAVAHERGDPGAEAQWARVAAAYAALPGALAACDRAQAHVNRGELALAAGRLADVGDAVRLADQALLDVGDGGCTAASAAPWLRGRMLVAAGDPAAAAASLRAALGRLADGDPRRAEVLDALARALHAARGDRDEIRRISSEARRHYAADGRHAAAAALERLVAADP